MLKITIDKRKINSKRIANKKRVRNLLSINKTLLKIGDTGMDILSPCIDKVIGN